MRRESWAGKEKNATSGSDSHVFPSCGVGFSAGKKRGGNPNKEVNNMKKKRIEELGGTKNREGSVNQRFTSISGAIGCQNVLPRCYWTRGGADTEGL